MMTFASHDEYFALLSPDKRDLLQCVQAEVEANVPGALRCVSYKMPAFKLEHVFFYFAAFKKHIGIYPPVFTPLPAPDPGCSSAPPNNPH